MKHITMAFLVLITATAVSSRAAPKPIPVGSLSVNTDPKGATVLLDDKYKAFAPAGFDNLPVGDHSITVTLTGHRDIRQFVNIQPDQRASLDLKMEALTGLVLIHSAPLAADVQVDGADKGKTPILLTDTPFGRHRVRISLNGYATKELDLTIKDRVPQKLTTTLTSDSAKLILDSDPAGGDVVLDGITKGKTPVTLDRIPAGDTKLQITMAGFAPYEINLKLSAGQYETLKAKLVPIPAELNIVTIPEKVRIYVNDQRKGDSPVILKNLAPGSYRIRAELRGYETMARTVEIRQAQNLTEEFRLARNTGIIEITTEPPNVKITIDGDEAGITATKPNDADPVSETFTLDTLTPGPHQVQLTRKGYVNRTITIEIETGKTAQIKEKLIRRFVPDTEIMLATGESLVGAIVEVDDNGNVKLEVRPGVVKTILAKDIRARVPIKMKDSSKPEAGEPAKNPAGDKPAAPEAAPAAPVTP